MRTPVLVAEIGCNHMGDVDLARRFVDVADTFCEVKHVKFQKRSVRDLLSNQAYSAPHPASSIRYRQCPCPVTIHL